MRRNVLTEVAFLTFGNAYHRVVAPFIALIGESADQVH